MNGAQTGTVKFFNAEKGYGFITVDGENRDIFVHATGLVDEIQEGDSVVFGIAEGDRGPKAVDVKLASSSGPAPEAEASAGEVESEEGQEEQEAAAEEGSEEDEA